MTLESQRLSFVSMLMMPLKSSSCLPNNTEPASARQVTEYHKETGYKLYRAVLSTESALEMEQILSISMILHWPLNLTIVQ